MVSGSVKIIVIAFLMNLAIAISKVVGFLLTSSTAMIAESLHSLADTANQVFLFAGVRQSKRKATEVHPYGFGKEQYVYSFLVAILLFTIGAAYSLYEGVHKLINPGNIDHAEINLAVLGLGFFLEGYSAFVATKEFRKVKGTKGFWQFIRKSKNPVLITVLFEDYAALLGLLFAFAGNLLFILTGNPLWDSVATLLIGLLLAVIASFLYSEIKSLLLGESASEEHRAEIRKIFNENSDVIALHELLTLHLSPDQILVNAHVKFRQGLKIEEVEDAVDEIESKIASSIPEVYKIFIETHQKEKVGDFGRNPEKAGES